MATHTAMAQGSNASMRSSLEHRLGIMHFVSTKKHGWSGQVRTRYTDFQVNEITKDGEVVHLNEFYNNARELSGASSRDAPAPPTATNPIRPEEQNDAERRDSTAVKVEEQAPRKEVDAVADGPAQDDITESDRATLVELVGQATTEELVAFYAKIQRDPKARPKTHGDIDIPAIGDKSQRSRVHGEIRRIFGGKIDTTTGSDGAIKATAVRAGNNSRQRGNRSTNGGGRNGHQNPAQGSGGPYLHFSLYKENKDTMDALNHMAKFLRIHPKAFGAAGTKDRRAVTVQRVSVKGRSPASLLSVNERINNIKIGDFKYAQGPIRLNDHDGNEFVIVLKNCSFSGTENLSFEDKLSVAKCTVDTAMAQVMQHGFLNYYGTQRFGTHEIGTQEVGMKILKGDFGGAVAALLNYDPVLLNGTDQEKDEERATGVNRDDINRARACARFYGGDSQCVQAALALLPPRCHVERTLMQHLGRNNSDHLGALMSINRSMRTMYCHAYQSLVWNFVASKRWAQFRAQVIKGDLVLVESQSAPTRNTDEPDVDMVWEEDIAAGKDAGLVAHAVTESDIQGGKYSVYDVVLPSPGWDVTYPPNEIGEFYAEFMGKPENGGLDPYNMRRHQRDFSLPGSYRKLMGKLKRIPSASVQAYSNDLEQLVPTDLDIIRSRKAEEAAKHDAGRRNPTSAWHTFSQTVVRNEIEESRARVARRAAEDPPSPVRINDTWVQTSLDGGNKRIKIARHTTIATDEPKSTDVMGGDVMQVEEGAQHAEAEQNNATTTLVNQPAEITGAQKEQQVHGSFGSSIIAAVTTQVRAITNSFLYAVHQVMAFLRMTTNRSSPKPVHDEPQLKPDAASPQEALINGDVATSADTNCPAPPTTHALNPPQVESNTNPNPASAEPQPCGVDHDLGLDSTPVTTSSDTGIDQANTTKAEPAVAGNTTDSQKIAVILRFALDTSQYATMVLRELQGASSANSSLVAFDDLTPASEIVVGPA